MAPSSLLQSRIQQFESLDARNSSNPPHPPRKSSLNYPPSSTTTNPLDDPISPTASTLSTMMPAVPYIPRKPRNPSASPSPPNLGLKTSLIDLKDWAMDDNHSVSWKSVQKSGAALRINDANATKVQPNNAPPLPPRTVSSSSSKSAPPTASKPRLPPNVRQSSSRSDSLTVEHSYPPLFNLNTAVANARQGYGHVSASSTSSFHSVSLSSDGGTDCSTPGSVSNFVATFPMDIAKPHDDSLDDTFSFENVSSAGIPSSPSVSSTHEWEKDISISGYKPEPPRLPDRGKPRTSLTPAPPSPPPTARPTAPSIASPPTRRAAPPPPPLRFTQPPSNRASLASMASTSTSDRSSIFSTGTVATARTSVGSYAHLAHPSARLARPTPVPPVARKRYEGLFSANIKAQRRAARAASLLSPPASALGAKPSQRKGWRGLSVDLITNPGEHPMMTDSGSLDEESGELEDGAKLDGQVVKLIWMKSRLDKGKLRDIWTECAPAGEDALDCEAFVRGMWRIDEELRRAQSCRETQARTRLRPSNTIKKRTSAGSLLR